MKQRAHKRAGRARRLLAVPAPVRDAVFAAAIGLTQRQWYILQGRQLRQVTSDEYNAWVRMGGSPLIAYARIGAMRVSTIVLPFDHNWLDEGRPIFFETMAFDHSTGEQVNVAQMRLHTYREAIACQRKMVRKIKAGARTTEDLEPRQTLAQAGLGTLLRAIFPED